MNKEKVMEAMNHIDPALIEAADRNISTAKHSRRGWSRPAVIAACLCMLLAGTAVAAELSGVRIVDFFNQEARSANPGWEPEIYSGYTVENDVVYFPIDALSPEIAEIDRSAERNVCRGFSSWKALEEFVGLDIMENAVLEDAPAGPGIDLGIEGGSGRNVVCVNAYKDAGVSRVYVCGSFLLHSHKYHGDWRGGVNVWVTAEIFTGRGREGGPEESSVYYSNEAEVSSEEYVTSAGLTVQLFRAYTPEHETVATSMLTGEDHPYTVPPWIHYDARFVLAGIPFRVVVDGELKEETLLRETILEVLDGFVCEPAN